MSTLEAGWTLVSLMYHIGVEILQEKNVTEMKCRSSKTSETKCHSSKMLESQNVSVRKCYRRRNVGWTSNVGRNAE